MKRNHRLSRMEKPKETHFGIPMYSLCGLLHSGHRLLAITLWVLAIGLWMPVVIPQNTNPYQELYDEVLAPVVKITSKAGIGSGVIISSEQRTDVACEFTRSNESKLSRYRMNGIETFVLTAAHVVGDENEVQVYIYEYEYDLPVVTIESATVVITDTDKDLTLLQITNSSLLTTIYSARLAPRDYVPYLFTEVYAVGCSLGLNPRPSEGILSALGASAVNHWEISAPILPGNSGGGVFLKDTHQLIGIAVWVRVYHGQLITTMAGVVPIDQIYEFLDDYQRTKELKNEGTNKFFRFSVLPFFSAKQRITSVVSRPVVGTDLTSWSSRGSECAIGTGGPAGQPNLRKEVRTMGLVVSHLELMVAYPAEAAPRIITKWVQKLKDEAPAIYEKVTTRISDMVKFQERLARPASTAYAGYINPTFISRAGSCADQITSGHTANLKRSYAKWIKKLTHLFETVDNVQAKRFKELVELMQSDYASGIAERTLPFTGTKLEGRGPASIAPMWLVNDVTVLDHLRAGDEVLVGGPKLICKLEDAPAFKAALTGRIIQAGAAIVKGNHQAGVIAKENDRINRIVNGYIDPYLNIEAFSTTGDSHVNFIVDKGEELFLDVKVAVTP